jgi:hypothetical protein
MNIETETKQARLTGGEIPEPQRAAMIRLRSLIRQEPDVLEVLALSYLPEAQRWLYLIKTPFATYPKYVVGTTDSDNEQPVIHLRCGQEWSARESFDSLNCGEHR